MTSAQADRLLDQMRHARRELSGIHNALHVIAEVLFFTHQPPEGEAIPDALGVQIDALKGKLKASSDALNATVEAETPSAT